MEPKLLPPRIKSPPQGRLDLIFLRPAIINSQLQPTDSLLFSFTWWGCEEPYEMILVPGADDVKIVFGICCDSDSFYRYLKDMEKLEVTILIGSNDQPSNVLSHSPKTKSVKKQYKTGDFIGKMTMHDLKFCPRGEYMSENDIYSMNHKLCGSMISFMLYTPDYKSIESPIMTKCSKENSIDDYATCSSASVIINSGPTSPVSTRNNDNQTANKSDEYFNTLEDASPSKNGHSKIEPDPINTDHLASDDIILKQLFKYLDCGAIQMSDISTLYQICQGRSPSLDLSCLSSADESMKLETLKTKLALYSNDATLSDTHDNNKIDTFEHATQMPVASKSINEKGSVNSPRKILSQKKFKSSPRIKRKILTNLPQIGIKTPERDNSHKYQESSLIILRINDVILLRPILQPNSKRRKSKGIKVRQRSKFCYLLQVTIFDAGSANDQVGDNALFVSREEINGSISFDCKKILQLANAMNEDQLKGYIQIRLMRRRMGERLGEELGVGISYLEDLYKLGDQPSIIELWTVSSSLEITANLSFRISFAFCERLEPRPENVSLDRLSINEGDEVPVHGLELERTPNKTDKNYSKEHTNERRIHYNSNNNIWVLDSYSGEQNVSNEELLDISHEINVLNCLSSRSNMNLTSPPTRNGRNQSKQKTVKSSSPHVQRELHSDLKNEVNVRTKLSDNKENKCLVEKSKVNRSLMDNNYLQTPSMIDKLNDRRTLNRSETFNKSDRSSETNSPTRFTSDEPIPTFFHTQLEEETNVREEPSMKKCYVRLEILEGSDFPNLSFHSSKLPVAPNCYVEVQLRDTSERRQTQIIHNNSQPRWDYKTEIELHYDELIKTNNQLILVVFHSMESSTSTADPDLVLGIAILDVEFIWTSFVSSCGWIPVHNRDGQRCGALKFSLTPIGAKKECREESFGVSQQTQTGLSLYVEKSTSDPPTKSLQETNLDVRCQNSNSISFKTDSQSIDRPRSDVKLGHKTDDETSPPRMLDRNKTFIISRGEKWSADLGRPSKDLGNVDLKNLSERDSPKPRMNAAMEANTWMNKELCHDGPCVSYLALADSGSAANEIKSNVRLGSVKLKKRKKSRVAAKFSLPIL